MEGYPKKEDLARFGLNPAFGETHFFCFTHYVLGTRATRGLGPLGVWDSPDPNITSKKQIQESAGCIVGRFPALPMLATDNRWG